MADKATTPKRRNPVDGDEPAATASKKLTKAEKEAAAVASNAAAAALDASYKGDKPALVGGDAPPRRGRKPAEKAPDPLRADEPSNSAGAELKQFIERMERLFEEKKAISDDIKDVRLEAKGRGFDVKTIDRLVKVRAKDIGKVQEEEAIFDIYASAIGLVL